MITEKDGMAVIGLQNGKIVYSTIIVIVLMFLTVELKAMSAPSNPTPLTMCDKGGWDSGSSAETQAMLLMGYVKLLKEHDREIERIKMRIIGELK